MTLSENITLLDYVDFLEEQLRWRDATKELPEESLYVIAKTKSNFYEPHSGRAFWDIVLTFIRDGEWQGINPSYEVMEWLPIPKGDHK